VKPLLRRMAKRRQATDDSSGHDREYESFHTKRHVRFQGSRCLGHAVSLAFSVGPGREQGGKSSRISPKVRLTFAIPKPYISLVVPLWTGTDRMIVLKNEGPANCPGVYEVVTPCLRRKRLHEGGRNQCAPHWFSDCLLSGKQRFEE
jgi:hypothetical protein